VADGGPLFAFPVRPIEVTSAPREPASKAFPHFFAVPMTALGIAPAAHGARE